MDQRDCLPVVELNRRAFLRQGTLLLAGLALAGEGRHAQAEPSDRPALRVGLITDLHYADRPPGGSRHYRETPAKLAEALAKFTEEKVDCIVALGDLIDSADSLDAEKDYLRRSAGQLGQSAPPGGVRYVLGNHCVSALTKPEYLEIVGQKASYDSWDAGGVHLVVLDACFRQDGEPYGRKNFNWTDANIPPAELEWLRQDLERTTRPTIVFVHQRLDVEPPLGIQNAPEVRSILEKSGRVAAVLQGHDHKGDYRQLAGIHYVTLAAMVEGSGPEQSAYAVMDVRPSGAIRLRGFRRQPAHELRR